MFNLIINSSRTSQDDYALAYGHATVEAAVEDLRSLYEEPDFKDLTFFYDPKKQAGVAIFTLDNERIWEGFRIVEMP